jgi:aromatic-L-amino-acid decarboxylase
MSNKSEEFKGNVQQVIDWIADYFDKLEEFPVKSGVKPGEIFDKIPDKAPAESEPMESLMDDLSNIILPGITHWQSPKFFAYFPANSSIPSLLAEMITAAMGVQGMKWETSPAAAELEEKVLNWLKAEMQLPDSFQGVIQDSASTSTLVSLLTAREKFSDYQINEHGFYNNERYRIYASVETHSSIERAVKVAGFGRQNLVKVPVDEKNRMDIRKLEKAIKKDIEIGYKPLCVVATLGTTGTTAIDPLDKIADLKEQYGFWLHIDAAFAGTALLLEEYQWMIKGIDKGDTFVFNPHKWLFTNFDCSAYFVKDKKALVNTFQLIPEYLKTKSDSQVNNYSDWTIPLGRRFRALKLWFVLKYYGMNEIRKKLRYHLSMAAEFQKWVEEHQDFEILAPLTMNLVCFRFHPQGVDDEDVLNKKNEELLNRINEKGNIYLTHTKIKEKYTLRMVIAQTNVDKEHIKVAWQEIKDRASELKTS